MFLKTQHQLVVQYNMIHVRKKVPTECTFKISLFPDLFQRLQFSLTRTEIPWLFRDLEEILFSLTISWPVTTMTATAYVGSSLTVHNPFLFTNWQAIISATFLLASKIKMIGMLLKVVHRRVHKDVCLKSFITNSTLLTMHGHKAEHEVKCVEALTTTVCCTAVLSVVTQRSSPQREKRDDTKNGCVAHFYNYESPHSPTTVSRTQIQSSPLWFFLGYQTIPSL